MSVASPLVKFYVLCVPWQSDDLLSGVLLDNAQELLKQPELTEEDLLRRFKVTVREAHKHGLTSIHDAGLDPISLSFFHRLVRKPFMLGLF
jgi:predicted amidohydrolase YtcJ